jgi:ABC-2 type transport system permease protein
VLTLIVPVLALLAIGLYHLIAARAARPAAQTWRIGYVDQSGSFGHLTTLGNVTFVPFSSQQDAARALGREGMTQFVVIPADYGTTGIVYRYITERELGPSPIVSTAVKDFLTGNLLAGNVPERVAAIVRAPLNMVTTEVTPDGAGAKRQVGFLGIIVPGVFSLMLGLSLIFSSGYLMQGLGEEKDNRLMEILLSSVSSRQLLTGKVLGLGAAGLLQVVVWVVSLPLLLRLGGATIGGFVRTVQVPPAFWALGVVYFVLGYGLFAVMSASVSAIASSLQEAQGFSAIYTLFVMAPFWFISLLMYFPNNPVWVVLSIFPLSAPVLVMLRLGSVGVPVWQLAASIAVLLVCVWFGLRLAGALLRTYVLMYGKRPSLKEIARSLKRA